MTAPELQRDIEDGIISQAISIIERRTRREGQMVTSSKQARNLAVLKLAQEEREVFTVFHLTNQHQLIDFEILFYGTIDGASVYPREVVKSCLAHNSAAVIIAHNHPSGNPTPSRADRRITEKLQEALALVDIRVLDHIIVAGTDTSSFSAEGLI